MLKFHKDATELSGPLSAVEGSDQFKVLRRLEMPSVVPAQRDDLFKGLFVDVETTGLDAENDKVIEFGGIPFHYDKQGVIHTLGEPITGFMDPNMPIPKIVAKLTGITDDMVKGQHFDVEPLEQILSTTGIVVAHNAAFDRPMCEKLSNVFVQKPWACSMSEVDWKDFGADNLALSSLLSWQGYFYEGHRAWIDCLAGIALLAQELSCASGRTGLSLLLESAKQERIVLKALDTPFETKDTLRARGYRWDPGTEYSQKGWYTEITPSALDDEKGWLSDKVFSGNQITIEETKQGAKDRFRKTT